MVIRHGYVYAGIRMEMKPGVLYSLPELRDLLVPVVVNDDPLPHLEAMIEDGLIAVHSRRYYLTPEGIAY